MNLGTYLLAAGLALAGMAVLAPSASATNYSLCAPTNAVCVVQQDGAGWDCSEGYLAWYGPKYARNGVFVNGPAGISADAWAGEVCARWFKWSTDQVGATAGASVGSTASLRASWWDYSITAAPRCAFGSYSASGTQLYAAATVLGDAYGVNWNGGQRTACGSLGPFCSTFLMTGGIADQDLGCPIGAPPAPPSGPFGGILP